MNSSTSAQPASTSFPVTNANSNDDPVPAHHASPVVAFIIGLSIILLASILNAGGLNLTKLDHVRTSAIPKASRRKDWLRPLWLLGMLLYILSQLIGSTLALEYMRAEYVAPLGSTSLIFNFLFASILVGTPVRNTDIYGTIIVTVGVVGIVLFGSINSGLETETDLTRLKQLWGRVNWLIYFFFMSFALVLLYIFVSQLELILHTRSDISAEPFAEMRRSTDQQQRSGKSGWKMKALKGYEATLFWIREKLESWTAAKGDKTIAWTLGIGWACCGGGLAGGCLVFAKACVKLISGTISHQNTGNQFAHVATIFTFLLLAITAIFQIICLNRGLKAYDSTLVVPVFYGVYTASGFLDSLIFNNEVDAYKSWTLFLIFTSIVVLISGVVLLTHEKPESRIPPPGASLPSRGKVEPPRNRSSSAAQSEEDDEEQALHVGDGDEEAVVWELGDVSDDEGDVPKPHGYVNDRHEGGSRSGLGGHHDSLAGQGRGEEGHGLIQQGDAVRNSQEHRPSTSSDATVVRTDESHSKDDEFGNWTTA